MQEIGINIKMYRKQVLLNQVELARAVGLSRVSIVNIEAGRQSPTPTTLVRICSILQCTPNNLFPGIPPSPAAKSIIHVNFKSKKDEKNCLENLEFVSALNKLTTKAYFTIKKK